MKALMAIAKLDDWLVLEGTLYHNQKLLNFLNMSTGDKKHSANDESSHKSG